LGAKPTLAISSAQMWTCSHSLFAIQAIHLRRRVWVCTMESRFDIVTIASAVFRGGTLLPAWRSRASGRTCQVTYLQMGLWRVESISKRWAKGRVACNIQKGVGGAVWYKSKTPPRIWSLLVLQANEFLKINLEETLWGNVADVAWGRCYAFIGLNRCEGLGIWLQTGRFGEYRDEKDRHSVSRTAVLSARKRNCECFAS